MDDIFGQLLAAFIAYSSNVIPPIFARFFRGMLFEPPLAGIKARLSVISYEPVFVAPGSRETGTKDLQCAHNFALRSQNSLALPNFSLSQSKPPTLGHYPIIGL